MELAENSITDITWDEDSWETDNDTTDHDTYYGPIPQRKPVYGCDHYLRRCKLFCDKCNKYYSCRICHDDMNNHKIDRFSINKILCCRCNNIQKKRQRCNICKTCFGIYYCSICSLYDDIDKDQYHCDKCGICRIGKEESYHCDGCQTCLNKSIRNDHKCYKYKDNNCPICLEDFFNSVDTVVDFKCGHKMHKNCLELYIKTNYKCPICCKSIIDTAEHDKMLDVEINETMMPEHMRNFNVDILCNECNEISTARYHILGHKCQSCNSYNTKRI